MSTPPSEDQSPEGAPRESQASASSAVPEGPKVDVSAATIGRMLGLATASELKVLEGKLDLLMSKINAISVRVDKIIGTLNSAPTGSDLERIDIQIGSIKAVIKETLAGAGNGEAGAGGSKRTGGRILSNVPEEETKQ